MLVVFAVSNTSHLDGLLFPLLPSLNCGCLYAQFLLVKQESPIFISKTHQNSVQTASDNNHKPEHHSEKLEESWKPLNMWSLKEETHSHRGLKRQIPIPPSSYPTTSCYLGPGSSRSFRRARKCRSWWKSSRWPFQGPSCWRYLPIVGGLCFLVSNSH